MEESRACPRYAVRFDSCFSYAPLILGVGARTKTF